LTSFPDNVTFIHMEYTISRPFEGDAERAFDLITAVFTTNNFRMVSRDARSLEFDDVGASGSKGRQLLGASRVSFSLERGSLTMHARMDGIRKISTALIVLPAGMGLLFLLLFGIMFGEMGPRFIAMISLGPVLPWVLVSPVLIRWLKKRSREALEGLIDSIVMNS